MLLGQPLLAGLVLALGTVAVLTGVVAVTSFAAILTGVDLPTQNFGAALFDGGHRFEMAGRDASLKLLAIGRAVLAENLGQFDHGRSAINWLMIATALVAPC